MGIVTVDGEPMPVDAILAEIETRERTARFYDHADGPSYWRELAESRANDLRLRKLRMALDRRGLLNAVA